MRRHTSPDGCTGAIVAVSGISRSCQARVASRSTACAGSSASKRRRAPPRSVPSTYSAARRRRGRCGRSPCQSRRACGVALDRALQAALQRHQRAAHPRLHGAERLAQLRRDLGVAEALEEGQRDALPLQRRELVHARRRARAPPTARLSRSSGPGAVVGHGVVHVFVLAVAGVRRTLDGPHLGLGLVAAQAVDRAIAGDAGEPRERLALRRIEAAAPRARR